jgi:SWI/SNF-related matrix-associated actin-dependent regulator of chromatin subfamily A member 5
MTTEESRHLNSDNDLNVACQTAKKRRFDQETIDTNKQLRKATNVIKQIRNEWIWDNRDIIEPLLPQESNFYTKEKEPENKTLAPVVELTSKPKGIVEHCTLKGYQLKGVSWLINMHDMGLNVILGDEMGLGKTLQTISLLTYLKFERGQNGPHLVVCPLSVLQSWMNEFSKWSPNLSVIRFHGSDGADREILKHEIVTHHYDVIVTTYEMYVAENYFFKTRLAFSYVILDEGHRIKNHETILAKAIFSQNAQYRLILTGTPLQNNMVELWSLFHWLYPEVFTLNSSEVFSGAFNIQKGLADNNIIQYASVFLDKIMLRRMKNVVDLKIPDCEEITIYMPIAPMQRLFYKKFLNDVDIDAAEKLLKNENEENKGQSIVNAGLRKIRESSSKGMYQRMKTLLFNLKMCCSHPFLCIKEDIPGLQDSMEQTMNASSKLLFLAKLLPSLKEKGHRVLIFAQYLEVLDILEEFFQENEWEYARMDGSIGRARRALDMRLFNKKDSPLFAYLLSTRSGGLGITLTGADTVIFYDSDFNPQVDLQAMARSHRIGQTKEVTVYRLCVKDTVEERLLEYAQKKLWLSTKITEDKTFRKSRNDAMLSTDQLLSTIKFGSNCVFNSSDSFYDFIKEDISVLLDRSKQSANLVQNTSISVSEYDIGANDLRDLRTFEGKTHKKSDNKSTESVVEELDRSSRVRKSRTVEIDGYVVSAESQYSDEAVPSIITMLKHSGKEGLYCDAADIKRKERKDGPKFIHDSHCHNCHDGGMLVLCANCPRSFHPECLGWDGEDDLRVRQMFTCPEHRCFECSKTAGAAGGLLLRCRTCPATYCETHVPPDDKIIYIGQYLPELSEQGYYPTSQNYFIKCEDCIAYDNGTKKLEVLLTPKKKKSKAAKKKKRN